MSDRGYLVADRDRWYFNYPVTWSHSIEAGVCNFSVFGVKPVLLDAQSGERIEGNGVSGAGDGRAMAGQMRTCMETISALRILILTSIRVLFYWGWMPER